VYRTGSFASYRHNDKSIGKYFHFLINILGQTLPFETGRSPMAYFGYCQCLLLNIEAGPIYSATEMDQLRSFPNSEKNYDQRNDFLNFASFSHHFYMDFLFYLTIIFCHFYALFRRACGQSADCATLMSQTSRQEVAIRSYQIK
jgi:hypothetical protein